MRREEVYGVRRCMEGGCVWSDDDRIKWLWNGVGGTR